MAERMGAKQRYQAVDHGQVSDGVFTIEEDDCGDELNIEKLSRMHSKLLSQAQDTISSTEDQVTSLQAERRENELAVREISIVSATEAHGVTCCGLRTRCAIM